MVHRVLRSRAMSRLQITKSVHAKLVMFFLCVAILPVATLCYFSYNKSAQIVNSQFGSYGMYAVEQLKLHLDTSLRQMDSVTGYILNYLISSPIVIENEAPGTYSQFLEEKSFKRLLASLENANILSVNIVTTSGRLIGNDAINPDKLLSSSFWHRVSAGGGRQVVIHRPDYYSASSSVNEVISLIVPIKNQFGLPAGSKVLIDMKADAIMKLVRDFETDTRSHLQIRNRDGAVLIQTSSGYEASSSDIVWSKNLETENWVVEARIPYHDFYESSGVILKYSLRIAIVALIFGALIGWFFSFRFTRPIQKLTQSIRRFGEGDLSIRTPVYTKDELGFLSESFNRMTGQIRDLIEEISLKEKLKSEAELKTLHYQINPHLLFNTLNSIQWKARLAGQDDIQKMLHHLIAVLEGSFNIQQVLVPFHKELEVALNYMEIQRYRYGDVFTYAVQAEDHLADCLIPRMVLQPLLENIFFHGFVDGKGHIDIRITGSERLIRLEIADNGMGIKPEHMKYIEQGQKVPGKKGGLGMRNVDERFKLHFGDGYGITVQSQRNQGTKVIMTWPKTV
ncbi:sensor histidine kinase [Paenibacillus hamazuiensis]|uniref:sensor histidine kinase n=1 Tax=Paenibacillus hamazuiensis TaxID=2936508 RepID=UPI0020102728|nr:sensor histidine kinase [Paenibacillus hamazuiensis]